MMRKIVLNNNYSIYQGVNFFNSHGSVTKIWENQMKNNEKLTITNFESVRYYCLIDWVVNDIINNIDKRNNIIIPLEILRIRLKDLYKAFVIYHNYKDEYIYIDKGNIEKPVEELYDSSETHNNKLFG